MKQASRSVSIKGLTVRYLTIILLFAIAGVLLIAAVGTYSDKQAMARHEAFELDVLSRDIGDLVGFYRQIAEAFARHQDVADILQFGDVERAVLWAKEVRGIVPESIGVALVEPDGDVMGEPLQLKLGKQCVADLAHMLRGEPLGMPPVHRSVPSQKHFDIIVPVNYNGEALGLLFMSFSLDVLKRRIEGLIGERQYLAIKERSGKLIADAGTTGLQGTHAGEVSSVVLPGTDWVMEYHAQGHELDRLLIMAIAIGGLIFVAALILTLFFYTRIVGFFSADLHLIRNQLDRVHAGDERNSDAVITHLRETEAIMADVSELVREIEQANRLLKQQSMHDALTGLFNRRAFDEALGHYAELARRGNKARLVVLDLDLFKQVNDHYGHGVGDEVLIALAESLRERCRSSDILARLGGDEFALILSGNPEMEIDSWFSELERRFIEKQVKINDGEGIEPHCHISAGSVVIDKNNGDDVKSLMEMADQQLYEAKRSGRGAIHY